MQRDILENIEDEELAQQIDLFEFYHYQRNHGTPRSNRHGNNGRSKATQRGLSTQEASQRKEATSERLRMRLASAKKPNSEPKRGYLVDLPPGTRSICLG